jgi:hypothetical protein
MIQRARVLLFATATASGCGQQAPNPSPPSLPAALRSTSDAAWWATGADPAGELWLSQTGLYADISRKIVAADVVGFEPRFQLWSDGAEKHRWLRVPTGAHIDNSEADDWQLPTGGVVFKEFSREGKRLETRVLARTGPGPRDYWLGAFAWTEDESDARLVPEGLNDARGTTHDVPSRKLCSTCHDGAPGRVLGLSALQRPRLPEELLQAPLPVSEAPSEPTTQAALGYLHANCAHCHNPRGSAFPDTDLDLRWSSSESKPEATLAYRTTLRVPLQFFRRTNARWRVAPGEPDESAVLQRMSLADPTIRMPPLGTEQLDLEGVAVVRAWIESLAR